MPIAAQLHPYTYSTCAPPNSCSFCPARLLQGTGKWTIQQAAELSVAAPTMEAALDARFLSGAGLSPAGLQSGYAKSTAC